MSLPDDLQRQVDAALEEDIGSGDITASLIPEERQASARVLCRDAAVICGQAWFNTCFKSFDPEVTIQWQVDEGARVDADTVLCTLKGNARSLLTVERTALNFLQTLSGVATETRRYVDAIGDLPTRILDTRKTLPGLRTAEKYAVACGGGKNHRIGLFDAMLIKENHIFSAGSITLAVTEGRSRYLDKPIEVETENLQELNEALEAGADIIMLDNYSIEDILEAVRINQGRAKLEVSGNVTLDGLRKLAETGVDYISIGALTKHVHAIDLSMRVSLDT
jgi:nicotinate-nucleotide pyrophosphorylase (carboxylating)